MDMLLNIKYINNIVKLLSINQLMRVNLFFGNKNLKDMIEKMNLTIVISKM